jgi:hypothetical protein
MEGFNIWQPQKHPSVEAVIKEHDVAYTFLLVQNDLTPVDREHVSRSRLVISLVLTGMKYPGKHHKILAGCSVRGSFLGHKLVMRLNSLSVFRGPLFEHCELNAGQEREVMELFIKMEDTCASDYLFKKELIKIFILQLVHFLLKSNQGAKQNLGGVATQ